MLSQKIRLIEQNFEVESIKIGNTPVWPYIRFALFAFYQSKVPPIQARGWKIRKLVGYSVQFFYGFRYFFRKYEHLALSDSSERKFVGGKWVDKSVDFIVQQLPNTLLIELPLPKHYNKSEIPVPFIVSKLPVYFLMKVYSIIYLRSLKIENEKVLIDLLNELKIDFDYRSVIKTNLAQYKVGKWLASIYNFKSLIVQCSYTNIGFVHAFRDKEIKVIEVQHGLISSSHEAYNVFKSINSKTNPDCFLSYGSREIEIFKNSYFFDTPDAIVPVGHFYLDLVSKSSVQVDEYLPEAKEFEYSVSITGQLLKGLENRLILFFIEAANRLKNVAFYYIPRSEESEIYAMKNLPRNFFLSSGRDTYEMLRLTCCHSTIFSTCAIESVALGTPNLLIDFDGLSKMHLGEFIPDSETSVYIDSVDAYVSYFPRLAKLEKKIVRESNDFLIRSGYEQNIRNFLNEKFEQLA